MKSTVVLPSLMAVVLIGTGLALANRVFSKPIMGDETKPKSRTSPSKISAVSPVLVELFTSEGCSSCPPADRLLSTLAKSSGVDGATIIPMEEHVDYWNHLGWADPYSNSRYSARQRSYAQLMHLDQVYTPQMVVNGQKELLGSDEDSARSAISDGALAAKTETSITATTAQDTSVSVNVHVKPILSLRNGESADVVVAITEDNLQSNVSRGENAGRRLNHTGVVRAWQIIGQSSSKEPFTSTGNVKLERSWKRPDLHAVVFVQGHDSGEVYGAATAKIEAMKHD